MYRKTLLVLLEENNYVLLAWVKEKSSRRYNECRRRSRRPPAANETPAQYHSYASPSLNICNIKSLFTLLHSVFTMFIYVFVALVEHKLLTSILHMYLRCFTVYHVHNIGTKGSQSRERHMAVLGK